MLSDGVVTTEIEADRSTVSALKGVGLNLIMLTNEVLHLLQDGVITKLQDHKQRTL